MFKFQSKKVFEKLNKMDRKQAYTIGAIAVVLIMALLMLVSAVTSGDDDSFDGMNPRGYDLAQMPFATDAAEQYLLAARYPDMRENGSTLLFSAAERERRQEEDAQNAADEAANEMDAAGRSGDEEDNWAGSSGGRGYGGYGRGGSGRGSTEIGQLSSAGMASSGASGISSTYGPSGDFRQFKGRENRGKEAPAQFKTADARQALAQFKSGSLTAARINENKMTGARKALMGGNVQGSDAFGKDGVDLSKLQNGGLTLDTSAPASTTDLDNLDKKVAEAAKKAEEQKKDENKRSWWEDMLIDLAKQAASSLVDSIMGTVGDTIRGSVNSSLAARKARNAEYRADSDRQYANLTDDDVRTMTNGKYTSANAYRKDHSQKSYYNNYGKSNAKANEVVVGRANEAAADARADALGYARKAQQRDEERRNAEQERRAEEERRKADEAAQTQKQRNACITAGKSWDDSTNTCK